MRYSLWRPRYLRLGSAAILFAALAGIAWALLYRGVPRTIVMATGPAGSAYGEFGRRYQEILARNGLRLTLRDTAGATENLEQLANRRSGVGIGFVESGLLDVKRGADVVSLGAIAFEPLWIFCRDEKLASIGQLNELRGKRISIGRDGGATRDLALKLLARNGIDDSNTELLAFPPE